LKALTKDYQATLAPPGDTLEVRTFCEFDLRTYVNTVYPLEGRPEFFETIAAIQGLYTVFKEVFLPLATAGLKEVDSFRRGKALREFLTNKDNREHMAEALTTLAVFINVESARQRHYKTKVYVDTFTGFVRDLGPGGKLVPAASLEGCENVLSKKTEADLRPEPEFQRCFNAAWTTWEPQVRLVLIAAAEYDVEADKTPNGTVSKVQEVVAKLQDIADGKVTAELLKTLFDTAVRLAALVEKTQATLTSEDNIKKINGALKKLQVALEQK
jgi:hypothetical protein